MLLMRVLFWKIVTILTFFFFQSVPIKCCQIHAEFSNIEDKDDMNYAFNLYSSTFPGLVPWLFSKTYLSNLSETTTVEAQKQGSQYNLKSNNWSCNHGNFH